MSFNSHCVFMCFSDLPHQKASRTFVSGPEWNDFLGPEPSARMVVFLVVLEHFVQVGLFSRKHCEGFFF